LLSPLLLWVRNGKQLNQTLKHTFCLKALPERFEGQIGEHGIVKSTNVPQGKYPSQVSVQHVLKGHECAGSIITAKWVLTGAAWFQS
jgi:secreted trypsin-like serine protease